MRFNKELIQRYLRWLSISGSKATVSSYRYALLSFWRWCGNRRITELTVHDIRDYQHSLTERNLKDSTKACYTTALKSLWCWLRNEEELVSFDATRISNFSRTNMEHRDFLVESDYTTLLNNFSDLVPIDIRDRAIVSFLFSTGVRVSELTSINLGDIALESKNSIYSATVKTYKRKNHHREIYWNATTQRHLDKWLEIREYVLNKHGDYSKALWINLTTNNPGARLNPGSVQRVFRRIRSKIKTTRHITPHSCRHGFATAAIKSGVDVRYVQELLGHASIKSTQIYTHLGREDLRAAYAKVRLTPVG